MARCTPARATVARLRSRTGASTAAPRTRSSLPTPAATRRRRPGRPLSLPTTEGGALRSQDLRTSGDPAQGSGAIIRVDPDNGGALADNPLVGNGIPSDDRHVAYGFRNPFRFTFRPGTNELWVGDVGWNTWEEIDRIVSPTDSIVENFGWPCYEGVARQTSWDNLNVNLCEDLYGAGTGAVTSPYWTYRHDGRRIRPAARTTAARSPVAFAGARIRPQYHGGLFVGDYVKGCVWMLMPGTNGLPDPANVRTILTGSFRPTW